MLSKIIPSLFLLLFLASCSQEKEIAEKDTIVVATSADNPPYEYIQDGKIIGSDIDIINAISKELGKKIIIKNLDFPALLPALSTNSVDLVIAGVTVSQERKMHIDFSDGYYVTSMAVLLQDKEDIKSLEDLKDKVIGVLMGSAWEAYAKALVEKFPEIRIKSLANNLVLVEELKAGNIDAIIMEAMQVQKFEQNIEGLKSFPILDTKSEFAIALPKGSILTPLINEAIQKLQSNGQLQQIKEKWIVK